MNWFLFGHDISVEYGIAEKICFPFWMCCSGIKTPAIEYCMRRKYYRAWRVGDSNEVNSIDSFYGTLGP